MCKVFKSFEPPQGPRSVGGGVAVFVTGLDVIVKIEDVMVHDKTHCVNEYFRIYYPLSS